MPAEDAAGERNLVIETGVQEASAIDKRGLLIDVPQSLTLNTRIVCRRPGAIQSEGGDR
jgi:hypothetical protein